MSQTQITFKVELESSGDQKTHKVDRDDRVDRISPKLIVSVTGF